MAVPDTWITVGPHKKPIPQQPLLKMQVKTALQTEQRSANHVLNSSRLLKRLSREHAKQQAAAQALTQTMTFQE